MNQYKRNLVNQIKAWRLRDGGRGNKPAGWQRWAKSRGMAHTTLFRFCQNGGDNKATLGAKTLHRLAAQAKANDDYEMIIALAEYAIDCQLPKAKVLGLESAEIADRSLQ